MTQTQLTFARIKLVTDLLRTYHLWCGLVAGKSTTCYELAMRKMV